VRLGVLTFEYEVRNFDLAWNAVDRVEPFDVIVRGWRAPILRRSIPLCEVFFGRERRSGPHTPSEILRIGLYGWFSPWLLGIYNHAIIAGMTAQWRETERAIIVSFRRRSP